MTVRLFRSHGFFSYGFTYCLADVYLVSFTFSPIEWYLVGIRHRALEVYYYYYYYSYCLFDCVSSWIVCSTMFLHYVRWTAFLVYCLFDHVPLFLVRLYYVPTHYLFDCVSSYIVCPTGSFIFIEQHVRYCHKIWGFLSPLSIFHAWLPQKDNSLEYGLDVIKFPVIRNHENVHFSIDWPDAINHDPTPLFDLVGLYVGKVFQKFLDVGMLKSPVAI